MFNLLMHKCRYCGYIGTISDFELDHPFPKSRYEFLQPLEYICSGCNREKSSKTPEEYMTWRTLMILNGLTVNYGPIKHREIS